jgi:hypothetical protein
MQRAYRHLRPVVTHPGEPDDYAALVTSWLAEVAHRGPIIEAYLRTHAATAMAAEAVAAVSVVANLAASVVGTPARVESSPLQVHPFGGR